MISNVCEPSKDTLDLQQINASLVDEFAKKERFYESEIKFLKEHIRLLQDKLFGRKSEKIKSDSDERQLLLLSGFNKGVDHFTGTVGPFNRGAICLPR